MQTDTGLKGQLYSWTGSIFYFGYLIRYGDPAMTSSKVRHLTIYFYQRVPVQFPIAEAPGWQVSGHFLHHLVRHRDLDGRGTKPSRHNGPQVSHGSTRGSPVPVLFHHHCHVVQAI